MEALIKLTVFFKLQNKIIKKNNNKCTRFYRGLCASRKKKEEEADEEKEKEHVSKMDAKLLSFTTFYYVVCKDMQ